MRTRKRNGGHASDREKGSNLSGLHSDEKCCMQVVDNEFPIVVGSIDETDDS